MIDLFNDKLYVTAQARIVESPEDVPREMAHAIERNSNGSFVWIAGRYAEADKPNRNGQTWSLADLTRGQASVQYTPMNVLHDYESPVGVFVETKMVKREAADDAPGRRTGAASPSREECLPPRLDSHAPLAIGSGRTR